MKSSLYGPLSHFFSALDLFLSILYNESRLDYPAHLILISKYQWVFRFELTKKFNGVQEAPKARLPTAHFNEFPIKL